MFSKYSSYYSAQHRIRIVLKMNSVSLIIITSYLSSASIIAYGSYDVQYLKCISVNRKNIYTESLKIQQRYDKLMLSL